MRFRVAPAALAGRRATCEVAGGPTLQPYLASGATVTFTRRFAAFVYLAVYALALAAQLGGPPGLARLAGLGLLVFILLTLPALSRVALVAGLALIALGLLLLPVEGLPAALLTAAEKTTPFLVLFAAVAMLQQPAGASPSVLAVGRWVTHQPPGRRFLALAGGGFLLGAALNLAGMALVAALLPSSVEGPVRRRLLIAILRGFQGAVCWSPLFVGVVAVLTVVPGVAWSAFLPYALATGLLIPMSAWAVDRYRRRSDRRSGRGPVVGIAPPPRPRRALAAVLLAFALLAAILGALVGLAGLPIILALGLAAPPFAFLWQCLLAGAGARPGRVAGAFAGRVLDSLPRLNGEAMLFFAANVLGLGLSAALQPATVDALVAALPSLLEAKLVILTVLGVGLSALGMHPVVFVIVLGHVLEPARLGLPVPLLASLLTLIWALGTSVSPFSATSLQMARIAGVSVFTLAWRWCGPLSLALAVVAPLLLGLLGRLL